MTVTTSARKLEGLMMTLKDSVMIVLIAKILIGKEDVIGHATVTGAIGETSV